MKAIPPIWAQICLHITIWFFIIQNRKSQQHQILRESDSINDERQVKSSNVLSTQCQSDSPLTMIMILSVLELIRSFEFLADFIFVQAIYDFDLFHEIIMSSLHLISDAIQISFTLVLYKYHTAFGTTIRSIFNRVINIILNIFKFIKF